MSAPAERDGYRWFIASSLVLMFGYGVAVGMFRVFPYPFIKKALQGLGELNGGNFIVYYHPVRDPTWKPILCTDAAYPGLNLVTRMDADDRLVAEILDMHGRSVHRWDIDWFSLWPDADHLPGEVVPKSPPGCQIHGAAVMPNGDLVFNFDYLGLIRVDPQGSVVWRLAYQTHHSLHVHDDGNIWVCGQKRHDEEERAFPRRKPLYDESKILEVSPDGVILHEWSVAELLRKNGRAGLLGLSRGFINGYTQQDILHLNDVEPFPSSMAEGFFEKGDVMVSLRNISTIFVFERDTGKIKYITTGRMIWQHDPDFVDGNTISVFDNKGAGVAAGEPPASRIVVFSAKDDNVDVRYEGTKASPFFTEIMGKHQWLPNGNVLITETEGGRAFEVNAAGEIVWQYVNFVEPGVVGIVEEVTRLPLKLQRVFDRTDALASISAVHAVGGR